MYLRHYCRGSAREAIECCLILPSDQGYFKARSILKNLFGQPHTIAKALINGLIPHGKAIKNDPDSMNRLAIRMTNCEITLSQMNLDPDLNSSVTLESIVHSLPHQLKYEWAKTADAITLTGIEPKFSDLGTMISNHARILSNRYGQIAVSSEQTKHAYPVKLAYDRSKPESAYSAGTFVTFSDKDQCGYCKQGHSISKCAEFSSLSVDSKWKAAQSKGLCFVCLKPSHVASQCEPKTPCGEEGCNRQHHKLLHRSKIDVKGNDSAIICATSHSLRSPRFGVVPVRIISPSGPVSTYASVDNGSGHNSDKGNLFEAYRPPRFWILDISCYTQRRDS